MRVKIDNLNIVKSADIGIDGLAVIAGENGTGKSTIGKALFATVKAASLAADGVGAGALKISGCAESLYGHLFRMRMRDDLPASVAAKLPVSRSAFLDTVARFSSAGDVRQCFAQLLQPVDGYVPSAELQLQVDAMVEAVASSGDMVTAAQEALKECLRREFLGSIVSLDGAPTAISVSGYGGESSLSLAVTGDDLRVLDLQGRLPVCDATYIESPLYLHLLDILSKVSGAEFFSGGHLDRSLMLPAHVADIVEKIESLRYTSGISQKASGGAARTLRSVAGGEFFYDAVRHVIMFRQGSDEIFPINVASGVKSLGMLQLLLDNKFVDPTRLLIWDEPENHLHPSWQVKLARILVELAAGGVPVVVSTHSPYFIQGIRYFAVKLGAERYVDYYLTEMHQGSSVAACVNDDLNRIFMKLAAPLNEIMDLG